jgi:translation initiation factor 5B
MTQIRQPIITVAGHVDHGKTSILDKFRGSSVQEGESGGITQKISFTKFPREQICKVCPQIKDIKLKIPGFLFIDTPGHAAFTNLRKRGGSLADLAILVVDIKEGIKPQTAEVISILKKNKTPFVIALNKIDTISGWQKRDTVKQAIETQAVNVKQEFDLAFMQFQGSLQSHGFDAELFYNVKDFTKEIAIVPCSAKTDQGIQELIYMLCGLSQRFLSNQLKLSTESKGVILEIKKEKGIENVESILHDGKLKENDEIAIATLDGGVLVSKIRALEEIQPLSSKYSPTKALTAATGARLQLTNKQGLLSGMPFEKVSGNLKEIEKEFKQELRDAIKLDKQGIVIKADSLGSLEALITLLRQANIRIVKAGIGSVTKTDVISAKANLEINPLDAVIVGFNVSLEDELELGSTKVLTDDVVYKLIESLELWRKEKSGEIERERLMGLSTICKLEVLPKYVFRNSNPAIFGVRVLAGKLKKALPLINEEDDNIARVKAIQADKNTVDEASEGLEVAMSLPGINFERKLKDTKYLYSQISSSQYKDFKKNKDLLSQSEIKTIQEIAEIKRRKNEDWGI